ncbi:MAG: tRNA-dihydrouridine synthase family protein, partial [Muribaculaceae bacterium]|nr:tRNA-dihydrouridine synthase family protein [Muribaculaceae bacterium]
AYRHFHALHYGHINPNAKNDTDLISSGSDNVIYTTPFIRLEKEEIRKKESKDLISDLNRGLEVVPQVIFKNEHELRRLIEILDSEGHKHIDLNMGCPFPLQTSRGRGAATIANEECHLAVSNIVNEYGNIHFSVKIRLGYDKEEYIPLIENLNSVKLDYITVHPRTAKDQYTGPLHIEAFEDIYKRSKNPIIYNGDIKTPEEAMEIFTKYSDLGGLMIGRGALARPSIFREIISGEEWDSERRRHELLFFHKELLNYYKESLIGGEHQVLSKILPFWEYSEEEIGRKAWKAIKKSSNMSKYLTALTLI